MRSAKLTHQRAKALRAALTPPELALWARLRHRSEGQPTFRRQHPFGPYILDFYCAKARLAIEIDGQAHNHGNRPALDAKREAYLDQAGIRVIRYTAAEVRADLDGIAQSIYEAAASLIRKEPAGCMIDARPGSR